MKVEEAGKTIFITKMTGMSQTLEVNGSKVIGSVDYYNPKE